ncbi:unnamed protein product [Cyclocybe aegerita]|uniref:DUF1279 domain-containing protein n=1 Tax=Cyclocybe aegerita TaxID=1973307 RepID=A0A8S0VQA3_CYCAE|nr:unnamed protein product [Cyclocybe aegerita]
MRAFIPRLTILRAFAPKVAAPLLPTTRVRLATSPLTNTPRPSRLFHNFPARLNSHQPPSPDPRDALPPDASLSQKLKHLIKTYGWYALGVYIAISTLDFSVAFLGVNLLGAEYVSQVAASVKATVSNVLHSRPAEPGKDEMDAVGGPAQPGQEGLYAMLVLAYTIHKTLFLPVRVGLTAALTPKLVHWLSRRGWAGTTGARRAASEMREKIRERKTRSGDD